MNSQGVPEMVFILDHLAVGSYMEALEAPSDITALLCVAQEKDIYDTRCMYHKVPITDMQPIPPEQLVEALAWIKAQYNHLQRFWVLCHRLWKEVFHDLFSAKGSR